MHASTARRSACLATAPPGPSPAAGRVAKRAKPKPKLGELFDAPYGPAPPCGEDTWRRSELRSPRRRGLQMIWERCPKGEAAAPPLLRRRRSSSSATFGPASRQPRRAERLGPQLQQKAALRSSHQVTRAARLVGGERLVPSPNTETQTDRCSSVGAC